MDIDHLWSSTIAGAFTGGILAALARMSIFTLVLGVIIRTLLIVQCDRNDN